MGLVIQKPVRPVNVITRNAEGARGKAWRFLGKVPERQLYRMTMESGAEELVTWSGNDTYKG